MRSLSLCMRKSSVRLSLKQTSNSIYFNNITIFPKNSNKLIQQSLFSSAKQKPLSTETPEIKSEIEDNTAAIAEEPLTKDTDLSSDMDIFTNNKDQSSDTSWKLRWFKFRRMAFMLGIPTVILIAGMTLHETDIPYKYAFRKLRNCPLPDEHLNDENEDKPLEVPNPAPKWALYLSMFWASWVHSQRPSRIMTFWDEFMPLLDKKYHPEVRMVPLACLLSMLGGSQDSSQPFIFFDKCLRKLEILQGYKGKEWPASKFLDTIYQLCGDVDNPQIMLGSLQLLMELSSIPSEPKSEDIDYIYHTTVKTVAPFITKELIYSLLTIYQDREYVLQFVTSNPPKKGQKVFQPKFSEIKRTLVKNRAMDFAFALLDSKSMQLQQMAMFILVGIVGRYPDIQELKLYLGRTAEEKVENGIKLVDTLARMGQEHYVRGENEAALGAFLEAIKFFPTSAQLRYFAAKCMSELGRIREAKEEYSKAMKLTPKQNGPMPEATLQLSNLLIKYGKTRAELEEAAMYLEILIDGGYYIYQTCEQIKLEDIYYRLQLCYEKLGRNEDALQRMLQLSKLNTDSHQCHFECGRLAIVCQEYEIAEEHLKLAIKIEPFDFHSQYYYALCLYHVDDVQECIKTLESILKNRSGDEKCLQLMARCYSRENKWEKVLGLYQTLNKSEKSDAFLEYQIGCVFENMHKESQAIASFTNSIDIWKDRISVLGFLNYFNQRPKDRKAFQNIQIRCQKHRNDVEWRYIVDTVFQIGMS